MASIITATVANGLTQSADNSGVLQLASGVGNLVTVPAGTGTAVVNGINSSIVSGTAVASTSGTSIDFTGIPSWVKRITVMFNGVSTNGASNPLIQLGTSGGVTTTGYASASIEAITNDRTIYTSGFGIVSGSASNLLYGQIVITNINGNNWVSSHNIYLNQTVAFVCLGSGSVSLSGTLDRVRITTTNGTDTFDAGTINILYE